MSTSTSASPAVERPDPLAGLVSPAQARPDGPCCPVHGPMRLKPRGCGFLCSCYPPQFRCAGYDGEGCPVTWKLSVEALEVLRAEARKMTRELAALRKAGREAYRGNADL